MDERFLRKPRSQSILDEGVQISPVICLLRVMFDIPDDDDFETLQLEGVDYSGPTYAAKELADYLGVSVFSIYKMFAEDRPLRIHAFLKILRFIHNKNPRDMRLTDFINGQVGCMAVPKVNSRHDKALQAIMGELAELAKR